MTDKLLNCVRWQRVRDRIRIVGRDFTRLFVTQSVYSNFVKSVGDIAVLEKTNRVAVTVNPVSPQGYVLDSKVLTETLTAELGLPVYNIREL